MSPPENVPPPPLSDHGGRRVRWLFRVIGGLRVVCAVVSLTVVLALAFRPPAPVTPASTMGALVIPGSIREFRAPETLLMRAAFAAPARGAQVEKEPAVVPSFTIQDEHGRFTEPEVPIVTSIDGQSHVTLKHLWLPDKEITVPVTELKLVNPSAKQTKFGACVGKTALKYGRAGTRNRVFFRYPSIACAAYTAWCYRTCGKPGMSFSATTSYSQLRKRGAKVVASRVSTKFAPYYKWYKPGDALFFHKGRRFGHTEIVVGHGLTSGTSSSMLRIGVRRIGNRGYALMSVLRP